ncbi:MAG: hypothetical protein E7167_03025 [Firmicutes bacterium]|nr:hypothetical protein [Bacillota bacterium]
MKKITLLFLALFTMFLGLTSVSAHEKQGEILMQNEETMEVLANVSAECKSMFGNPNEDGTLAYYLQMILDIIKYAGIVLCILLTIVDFAKALLGDDKEMYKPLAKTAFTRLAYAVMLFFLPMVVKTILLLIGAYDTCGIM